MNDGAAAAGLKLVWGAPAWFPVAGAIVVALALLLVWGYRGARAGTGARIASLSLKLLGVLLLASLLLEPLLSGVRARPGSNLFLVLADNSQSMTLKDAGASQSRADQLKSIAPKHAPWLSRLGQDFDLRQYAFDAQLKPAAGLDALPFDGHSSHLAGSLTTLLRRYQGRPLAGILLLSDGSATDAAGIEQFLAKQSATTAPSATAANLPPIYPVVLGAESPAHDVSLDHVTVTQSNFEDAPVSLAAQVSSAGYAGRTLVAQLLDESGKAVDTQTLTVDSDARPLALRFRVKPEKPGVSFYRVQVSAKGEPTPAPASAATQPTGSPEATLANNSRLLAVDRGKGPYRVLYVSGRPNWEYKFLQRSLAADDQVQLVSILRIARREAKFSFRAKGGADPDSRANPLFRGFDNKDAEQVADYDQPVIVRLGTHDEDELRGGFPKAAEELYRYHAIVLDDVESEFFTQDQMLLVKEFVRQRGGGLLMLGGQETFKNGRYDRTPIGDLLPVYADEVPPARPDARYRMALTREGWLEPWVRLRPEETAEQQRLTSMPPFWTLNHVRGIKPGATVLARAEIQGSPDAPVPALVEQRFGQGRVATLLIGDLWRWGLRRPENAEDDLGKAWRQAIRYLVAEVPKRVELIQSTATADPDSPEGATTLTVQVRDPAYAPLDNASVAIKVTSPDGKTIDLRAEPTPNKSGQYQATYVPRQPGPYRASASVTGPDGAPVGEAQTGWASDPAADEFQDLHPNRPLLDRLARATGGQLVQPTELESFVTSLPTRRALITEPYTRPLWHQPWVFAAAILCLTGEWALRRLKGLP